MDYSFVLQMLLENSSKKYDDFNKNIVNSGVRTIGCTVPFLRSVVKKYRLQLQDVATWPTHDYFEVDFLKGIVVSTAKLPFAEKSKLLLAFADTLENWAVCDCCVVKTPVCEREQYMAFFLEMCKSEKPFVCRYALVNLISFLDEKHIDDVFAVLKNVRFGHYYVDMAVAWLVATAMAKCRNQTVSYMEGEGRSVLNKFAYNKALQKMRDSNRVSSEYKQWTKGLKM